MIHRYAYGAVIETDAVLNKPKAETEAPPFFSVDAQAMTFTCQMGDRDRVIRSGGKRARHQLIPLSKGGQCVSDVDFEDLQYLAYPAGGEISYEYYHDGGCGKDYDNPNHMRTIIRTNNLNFETGGCR